MAVRAWGLIAAPPFDRWRAACSSASNVSGRRCRRCSQSSVLSRRRAAGLLFFKIDSEAALNIPSKDGTFLGGEINVFADWRIASDVSMNLRYGVFFPGEAGCCPDDPRHFVYVGFNYAF